MSTTLWFGTEWEIALSAIKWTGAVADTGNLLDCIDRTLVRNLRHVPDSGRGWWLENGAKYYRDASQAGEGHDEYSSPECCHPDDLLLQEMAGERLVLALAEHVTSEGLFEKINVSKANVCYSAVTSWGAHENYHASGPVAHPPMLAWLVGRTVPAGSGGLDVRYPGIRFTCSPRSHFIDCPVSNQTEHSRGLHNSGKASSLGTGHRVHVVAGDGNRAPLSTWLKIATTAIVIRLIDTGRAPSIGIARPVEALHEYALDPTLTTCARDSRGRPRTALGIQAAFLDAARAAVDELPDWTPPVLEQWQRVLDGLGSSAGWRSMVGELDWPTKLALFERTLEKNGWSWERVEEFNRRLNQSTKEVAAELKTGSAPREGRLPRVHAAMMKTVRKFLGSSAVEEFADLRRQLAIVDARYMQLGAESLYEPVASPLPAFRELALSLPPAAFELPLPGAGRARVRAQLVREHGSTRDHDEPGDPPSSEASWTYFRAGDRYLDMSSVAEADPAAWRDPPSRRPASADRRSGRRARGVFAIVRAASQTSSTLNSGHYAMGAAVAWAARDHLGRPEPGNTDQVYYWRESVRIHARFQDEERLDEALRGLKRVESREMEYLWDECNARTWLGLRGHASVPTLAEEVKRKMSELPTRASGIACWKSHFATWLNRNGRPAEARALLESAMNGQYDATSPSVQVRICTQIAEASRMLGDCDAARECFDTAERICRSARVHSGLIDFVETGRARLLAREGDRRAAARLLLETVLPEQRRRGMPNRIRTRLMLARLGSSHDPGLSRHDERELLRKTARPYSAYAHCPLLAQILEHWTAWCEGWPNPSPDADPDVDCLFWGA